MSKLKLSNNEASKGTSSNGREHSLLRDQCVQMPGDKDKLGDLKPPQLGLRT